MLEKIKTLLDSGCWVQIKINDIDFIAIGYEYRDCHIIYVKDSGESKLYRRLENRLDGFDIIDFTGYTVDRELEITSVEPIARPLYQYKAGDKVVVLDNYEGKYLIFGEIVEITNIWNGTIEVEKNKDIYSIDIRCIAPVLD